MLVQDQWLQECCHQEPMLYIMKMNVKKMSLRGGKEIYVLTNSQVLTRTNNSGFSRLSDSERSSFLLTLDWGCYGSIRKHTKNSSNRDKRDLHDECERDVVVVDCIDDNASQWKRHVLIYTVFKFAGDSDLEG